MPKLIGLTGCAGAGKDSVYAAMLFSGRAHHRIALASPLKAMLSALLTEAGVDDVRERVDGSRKGEIVPGFGVTARRLAQTLGTEWGRRECGDDLWANIAMARAEKLEGVVVITDVRFDNEARKIRERGGQVFLVRGRAADLALDSAHRSEAGVSPALLSGTIWNSGTLEDLRDEVARIFG